MRPLYIGTSGWSYDHWHGVLYPDGSPPRERLGHYLAHGYRTVELNASFYRWPRDATFASWNRRLPEGFRLAVKAPRGLTHGKRLYGPEVWLERVARGLARLDDSRRGPLLVQTPPDLAPDLPRLAYFLESLPPLVERNVVLEFRHPDWHGREDVFALLERHGAAYCVMSGARLPCVLRATPTASFAYVRLHGPDADYLYGGSYSDDDLRWWAGRIREWESAGKTVYAYFNNDGYGNAVRNADALRHFVGA